MRVISQHADAQPLQGHAGVQCRVILAMLPGKILWDLQTFGFLLNQSQWKVDYAIYDAAATRSRMFFLSHSIMHKEKNSMNQAPHHDQKTRCQPTP